MNALKKKIAKQPPSSSLSSGSPLVFTKRNQHHYDTPDVFKDSWTFTDSFIRNAQTDHHQSEEKERAELAEFQAIEQEILQQDRKQNDDAFSRINQGHPLLGMSEGEEEQPQDDIDQNDEYTGKGVVPQQELEPQDDIEDVEDGSFSIYSYGESDDDVSNEQHDSNKNTASNVYEEDHDDIELEFDDSIPWGECTQENMHTDHLAALDHNRPLKAHPRASSALENGMNQDEDHESESFLEDEDDDETLNQLSPTPPPKSQLVKKMFYRKGMTEPLQIPKARYGPGKEESNPEKTERKNQTKATAAHRRRLVPPTNVSTMSTPAPTSAIIETKMKELAEEMEHYQAENKRLVSERRQLQHQAKELSDEKHQFEDWKANEIQNWELVKVQEMKKIKTEKRVMERQMKARMLHPDRKERAEIDGLKAQVVQMKCDERQRLAKAKVATDRLKLRMKEMEAKNKELTESLTFAETQRIEAWEELKDHRQKDAASTPEAPAGSTPSLTSSIWTKFVPQTTGHHPDLESSSQPNQEQKHAHHPQYSFSPLPPALSSSALTLSNTPEIFQAPEINVETETDRIISDEYDPQRYGSSSFLPMKNYDSHHGRDKDEIENDKYEEEEEEAEYEEIVHPDGKRERRYFADQKRVIHFVNGTEKEIHTSGLTIVRFNNGDIKTTRPEAGTVEYYYAEAETNHTTYPDATEVFEFPNDQVETHYPDGSKKIVFPDGTRKIILPNGDEQSYFTDGSVVTESSDGSRTVIPASSSCLSTSRQVNYPSGYSATATR